MKRYDFRPSLEMPQIYLYREPVDFRKSFRGLTAIVEQELEHMHILADLDHRFWNKLIRHSGKC